MVPARHVLSLLLTPPGGFKVHLEVKGLAPGHYALYVHEGGSCASYAKRITG